MSFFGRTVEDPPAMVLDWQPRTQRVDYEEREKQIREAAKAPLTAAEVLGVARLTLAEAFALITENGGQVEAGPDGELAFLVSAALPPIRRHRVVRAARVLDASRAVVWRHLPLPARVPAAGGGIL